jgi:hypothetical protein
VHNNKKSNDKRYIDLDLDSIMEKGNEIWHYQFHDEEFTIAKAKKYVTKQTGHQVAVETIKVAAEKQ